MIMHLDMNSYFATAEQQSNPYLRGKPICIAGKGKNDLPASANAQASQAGRTVCAAASIEAKKYGVKSGTSVWQAKVLCPNIQIVPADYEKYQFISRQVFALLEEYTPKIEIFSIDEAFMDLDHIETYTEAAVLADEIKWRIRTQIGDYLKCSVGLAENKLLAKLASEKQKPDGLTIIKKNDVLAVLEETPIEEICGIGRHLQFRLNQLGIKKVAELGRYPLANLIKLFGINTGQLLKKMGQGIDSSKVLPYFEFPAEKSFGHSYTLPSDISDLEDVKKVLLKLSEKVGRRLRKKGFFGRTIHIYLRFHDFTGFSQQITTHSIQDGFEIYQTGLKMIEKFDFKKPVRLIGISIGNLSQAQDVTPTLLTYDRKREQLLKATDKINDHFGEFTIFRAALTKIKNRIENIPDGRNKRII